jgi:two-component system, chemotaxis family, chemotaxis protein CheY
MKKVMIVDDSSTIREQVKAAFATKPEYQMIEADNGVSALAKLEVESDVRLIISDVNMPEMDGITLLKHVTENPKFKATPIIMLTTEVSKELKEKAKTLGVRAWIVKPFAADKLILAVDQLTK